MIPHLSQADWRYLAFIAGVLIVAYGFLFIIWLGERND